MIKQFELGGEALKYIKGELALGKSLAKHLLNSIDFDDGRIITFLPEDTAAAQLLTFQYGGVVKTSESREKVVALIREYLEQVSNAYCIFEEEIATLDHQTYIQNSDDKYFTFDSEIYDFLDSNGQTLEKIEQLLRIASGYPGIGILTFTDTPLENLESRPVSETLIEDFSIRATHVLVQAYDGEAWLIWEQAKTV